MHPERASVMGTMGGPSVTGVKWVIPVQLATAPYVHLRAKMVTVLFLALVFVSLAGMVSTVPSTFSATIRLMLVRMHWFGMSPLALFGTWLPIILLVLRRTVHIQLIHCLSHNLLCLLKGSNPLLFYS
jgi:hypothetical protein